MLALSTRSKKEHAGNTMVNQYSVTIWRHGPWGLNGGSRCLADAGVLAIVIAFEPKGKD
jgi:hypothetical protein